MISDEDVAKLFDDGKDNPINTVPGSFQKLIRGRDYVDQAALVGFYYGYAVASRLERIKTLEEVREIGREYGCCLDTSFIEELDRLIEQAKSE